MIAAISHNIHYLFNRDLFTNNYDTIPSKPLLILTPVEKKNPSLLVISKATNFYVIPTILQSPKMNADDYKFSW